MAQTITSHTAHTSHTSRILRTSWFAPPPTSLTGLRMSSGRRSLAVCQSRAASSSRSISDSPSITIARTNGCKDGFNSSASSPEEGAEREAH